MSAGFNPFDPDFTQNPYPTYARLRAEGPVNRIRVGLLGVLRMLRALLRIARRQGGIRWREGFAFLRQRARARRHSGTAHKQPGLGSRIYTVARYDEVAHVLRHPEIFSSEVMGGSQAEVMGPDGEIPPTAGALIGQDPPEHTRQRSIVNRGFTPRRIAEQEPRIRRNAESLLSAFVHRGECDLMADFANPLPVSVIADLMGLDPERRDDFKRWSTALIVGSTQPGSEGFGGPNVELFREFRRYMSTVIEERRRQPGDDLISTLIDAGEGEGILDAEQVISFATLMLAAGSETTTNLIGNAMLALFRDRSLLERVQRDPKLIPRLVEETLRFDPPVQLTMRIATRDTEVAGVRIPRRSLVAPLIGSANRDERKFEHPDRFDLDRPESVPHLAFGFGNHFCIGASLARMEGVIALELILGRLRGIELLGSPDSVERHGSFLIRGPSALPVRFEAD